MIINSAKPPRFTAAAMLIIAFRERTAPDPTAAITSLQALRTGRGTAEEAPSLLAETMSGEPSRGSFRNPSRECIGAGGLSNLYSPKKRKPSGNLTQIFSDFKGLFINF